MKEIGKLISYREIDSYDLEKVIKDHYKRKYNIVAGEELSNDSQHTFHVDKKSPLDDYDQRKLDNWIKTGKGGWVLYPILQDMVNKELIPPAEYLVTVCW